MKERKYRRDKKIYIIPLVLVTAAAAVCVTALLWEKNAAYLDSCGWLFAGSGTPEVIELGGGVRLERALAFREDYRVCGIDGDTVNYRYKGKYGAVGTDGVIAVPYGELPAQAERPSEQSRTVGDITLTVGKVLEVTDENSVTESVFDGWQLDEPRIYGEYIAVRIYWCDCVYKIVHN
ncbi:MAG: hypothetical protein IJT87_06060 [Ruminiclostridium sp.]|nr:hypothetical protein [Ruminiclostridium sp.]